jgi:hypothetical protein
MSQGNGAGKGDTPRPVDHKKYDKNFGRIFGKRFTYWDRPEHKAWVRESRLERDRFSKLDKR